MSRTKIAAVSLLGLLVLGVLSFAIYRFSASRQAANNRSEAALAPQGKLPGDVRPLHYDLRLRVDPDQDDFSGSVGIDVMVEERSGVEPEASRTFWIHGEGILASRAELVIEGGRRLALDYHEMGESGVVRLRADEPIPVGKARIEIDYAAPFDRTLEALYLFEADSRRYAISQLEAIDARQVFPSFDEPGFKVPFDITLEVREAHEGITTTPERSSEALGDGYRRLSFETTPPLPTYLLAFAVGPYDIAEADPIPASALRPNPIPLRGLATAGKGEELTYALKNTAPIVLALEEYFGRPYPYRKLDLAAVPDFNFGAMENVGLIVYRETLLLLGENPGVDDIRAYVSVHAHELAHQWFGNLVTMPWWDDIWLNESFATWMGNLISHRSNPTLEFDRETVRDAHGVMGIDVYADTRLIREPVEGREEIANAFDWISYAKGGAFLQMVEDWIGPDRFQQGIRNHLEKHAEGTAGADDFLASLSLVADGEPVVEAARSFLEQRGLPLVTTDWNCKDGQTTLTVTQSRYLEAGSKLDPNQSWVQPFCALLIGAGDAGGSGELVRACTVIDETPHRFSSVNEGCPIAILPNAGAAGYFRWTLDERGWDVLLSQISNLAPAEKLSVASNLAADFRAGRLSASGYLARIPAIIEQPEWDVATSPIGTLGFISDFIADPKERPALGRYVASLYAPHLEEPDDNDDDDEDDQDNDDADSPAGLASDASPNGETARKLLRSDVLYLLAVTLKDPEYVGAMAALGRAATGFGGDGELDLAAVEGDLLQVALASAIQEEGEPFFSDLKAKFEASKDGSFRRKALSALGVTTEPALAEELRSLGFLWGLRLNEIPSLVYAQGSRVENRAALFAWLKRIFPIGHRFMPDRYVSTAPRMASGFCDEATRDELEAFFSDYVDESPGMSRNLSQALERIELCESLVSLQEELVIPPARNVGSLTYSNCPDLPPSRPCPSPTPSL